MGQAKKVVTSRRGQAKDSSYFKNLKLLFRYKLALRQNVSIYFACPRANVTDLWGQAKCKVTHKFKRWCSLKVTYCL